MTATWPPGPIGPVRRTLRRAKPLGQTWCAARASYPNPQIMRLLAGVRIAVISKIFGHSSVAVTADIYSQPLKGVTPRDAGDHHVTTT